MMDRAGNHTWSWLWLLNDIKSVDELTTVCMYIVQAWYTWIWLNLRENNRRCTRQPLRQADWIESPVRPPTLVKTGGKISPRVLYRESTSAGRHIAEPDSPRDHSLEWFSNQNISGILKFSMSVIRNSFSYKNRDTMCCLFLKEPELKNP
jgi:hypothetical protein